MSYARLNGTDSDVYVWQSRGAGYHCTWCSLDRGLEQVRESWWRMVLHLLRHRLAGDRVPFRAFWGIYRERNEA